MVNSSLVQEVVNATPSDLVLAGLATLSMTGSTLNLDGIGQLQISANSSVSMVTSGVVNSSIIVSNAGSLSATSTSILDLNGLNSSSIGPIKFTSSRISVAPQSFTFHSGITVVPVKERGDAIIQGDSTLDLNQTTFQADNTTDVLLNCPSTLILDSQIQNSNISNFAIGYSTLSNGQTSIVNSKIQSALTVNVTVGAPGPSSTTEISSSTILFSSAASQNALVYGTEVLTVSGSSVISLVGSTTRSLGSLALVGGAVFIIQSVVQASDFDYYGYTPLSTSSLVINSTLYFDVISSKLISGQSSQTGIYETAHITVNAGTNMTVEGSLIQSESLGNSSITLRSSQPNNILHNATMAQDVIQTGPNPSNITFSSGYGLLFNRTQIITNINSTISVNTYQLISYDSVIPANITVGRSIAFAYLYNTTVVGVVGLKTGTYQNYEYLFVKVDASPSSQSPASFAKVVLLNSTSGSVAYEGETNASGWAKFTVLQSVVNSTASVTPIHYVVQASSGSSTSNQVYFSSNATSDLNLALSPSVSGSSSQLGYYTYPIVFGAGSPQSYIGIRSNAYPLNFVNNASFSELDFNTIGLPGPNYTFTIVYPANFTNSPLTVKVDQIPLTKVKITSNATYYFASFSIPAGVHQVTLTYYSPNGSYNTTTNPILNPSAVVIAATVLILLFGTVFIIYYVRRQSRSDTQPSPTSSA